ncbi:MAG TPA: hypothetical protein PLY65_12955 [Methanothrix soehngenii]|jgi:hypothetical protein|nr:hypothetical protein [Methanothrix soehngenii]HOS23658.1 hypothetical protein [Methanothrix soehngenii]
MNDRLDHEAIQEEMDFASFNNNNARYTEIKPQRAHDPQAGIMPKA